MEAELAAAAVSQQREALRRQRQMQLRQMQSQMAQQQQVAEQQMRQMQQQQSMFMASPPMMGAVRVGGPADDGRRRHGRWRDGHLPSDRWLWRRERLPSEPAIAADAAATNAAACGMPPPSSRPARGLEAAERWRRSGEIVDEVPGHLRTPRDTEAIAPRHARFAHGWQPGGRIGAGRASAGDMKHAGDPLAEGGAQRLIQQKRAFVRRLARRADAVTGGSRRAWQRRDGGTSPAKAGDARLAHAGRRVRGGGGAARAGAAIDHAVRRLQQTSTSTRSRSKSRR